MRQELLDRLESLLKEKVAGSWKDGWVYGRLKQEFDLQPDELEAIAIALKFKYGWNPALKEILEKQWQEDEVRWMQHKLAKVQKQASLERQKENISQKITLLLQELQASGEAKQELSDIEKLLIRLILKMNVEDQRWMLEMVFNRYKF